MSAGERIGSVLSGGGARGAYGAGAISVLAPALEARDEQPTLFVGTSVGAINAAYMGASMHLSAEEQASGLLERWRAVTKGRLIRPILLQQLPLTALRYAGELLSLPGVRLPSLLDPKPLEHSLRDWMSWEDLHRNVAEGLLDAVAVVATAARTGRTVAFVESSSELSLVDPLGEDMRMLGNVNEFFADHEQAPASVRYRVASRRIAASRTSSSHRAGGASSAISPPRCSAADTAV
jgi:NTE family protein